ncbi:cation:proton antiporter [archaeon]|nr:cation:proton antiporter [archaeon]
MMDVFVELSLIVGITVIISAIIKLLKQPLIIGYIISGIVVSPYFLNLASSAETIEVFAQIGITLLLFIVGIGLSPRVIKEVGKVSLITGIGQILFTSLIGFFISLSLGFSVVSSLYICIALTFSSTIIIMKLLSDKKDLDKLYGKISIGFLLVQDLFVIVLLMIISSFSRGFKTADLSLGLILGVVSFVGLCIIFSIFILPKVSKFFAKSQEFLFLFSVGWGLGFAAIFYFFGFSMEIGALVAGIMLSMSPYSYEISSKMKPLRDFFIILFFVSLGSQMVFGSLSTLIVPAIIFSAFILVGNPLIVIIIMGALGYNKKVGFQAGLTVAQISEFSLLFVALGVSVGHLTGEILSLITIVGLITISGSTYLVTYSDKIYPFFARFLSIFERKNVRKDIGKVGGNYDLVLFGYNRIGYDLLDSFKKLKKKFLVVDYNPEIIRELEDLKIKCLYGDVDDKEFLESLDLSKTKMIVSTVPSFETNMLLMNHMKETNKDAILIMTSHNIDGANELYAAGATYVIMPHFLGGSHASMLINNYGFDSNLFKQERESHLAYLEEKKRLGHEHPDIEKNPIKRIKF